MRCCRLLPLESTSIDAMIEAKDEEEVHAIMAQTSVGKRYLKGTEGFEDDIPLCVFNMIPQTTTFIFPHTLP